MNVPYLSQDQIKNIKKSIITNLTQLDASLKNFVEVEGNHILTL